jgi:hypothetical protein
LREIEIEQHEMRAGHVLEPLLVAQVRERLLTVADDREAQLLPRLAKRLPRQADVGLVVLDLQDTGHTAS